MDSTNSIWIVTDDTPQIALPDGARGGGNSRSQDWGEEPSSNGNGVKDAVQVDEKKLEQEMSRFLLVIDTVFTRAEEQTQAKSDKKSGMQLDTIELSVEINGEGKVKLLGSGMTVGGKGGIKLTFKRKPE